MNLDLSQQFYLVPAETNTIPKLLFIMTRQKNKINGPLEKILAIFKAQDNGGFVVQQKGYANKARGIKCWDS